MFNTQLTAQQRLDKAVIAIMGHERYTALAGILMLGERKIVDSLPPHNTACTNGRDEWYCKSFIEDLSDAELRFLVLHESYHKMYRHLTTWENLHRVNPTKANKACDYMINIRITDDNAKDGFAKMPSGEHKGLCDPQFRNMNAAEIFKKLPDSDQGGEGGGGDGDGTGFDDHDWEGAKALTDQEKHELEREIDEAVRQGALVAGKTGTGGNRDIEELLEPTVDWREQLRDFVTSLCAGNDYSTWRMPSKRYIAGGMYMPRGVSEQVEEVCVEIDMSGSTWNIVKNFMAELKGILEQVRPQKVRLIYWDTEVCREESYTMDDLDNLLKITKPKGGGGTVVSCVPNYCNEFGIKPQVHIVLTDGYLGGDWGTGWNAPVLWVVCDNNSARATNGTTIHINSGDF